MMMVDFYWGGGVVYTQASKFTILKILINIHLLYYYYVILPDKVKRTQKYHSKKPYYHSKNRFNRNRTVVQ